MNILFIQDSSIVQIILPSLMAKYLYCPKGGGITKENCIYYYTKNGNNKILLSSLQSLVHFISTNTEH